MKTQKQLNEIAKQLANILEETLPEITRLNKAAGQTVFNPVATESVKQLGNIVDEITNYKYDWYK